MKKLMIVALAAVAMGANAASCTDPSVQGSCQTVFTVKFSGKTATEGANYKTTQKLSAKGYLTLSDTDVSEEFTQFKIGKEKYNTNVLTGGTVTKMTYFGKNLATVQNKNLYKPGKTYSLEGDLGVKFEGADLVPEAITSFNINQVAFGKVKVYISKATESACGEKTPGCLPIVTPVCYSGWFTGDFQPLCLDEANYNDCCYEFAGSEIALIGGTWTAKYNKGKSVKGTCAAPVE